MSLGRTHAVALLGLQGAMVEIEADISSGLPKFILIGLPDAALRQAEHRVHAAANNAGCPLQPHKLTINLSPAALPKFGSGFDLGIAVACIRCPMLRPDPAQRARLEEIRTNLTERALEAETKGWLGELEGIQISITAAEEKLATMDRIVRLEMPTIRTGKDL